MANKKNLIIALIVTISHFALSTVIGYYIAVQTGTQMGRIVGSGLIEASKKGPQESDEEASKIYQNMEEKIDDINDTWRIPSLLISLPAKPLMNPFLGEIRKNQLKKVIAREITREQFRARWKGLGYVINFVNSLSLGLIVYLILRILKSRRKVLG